VLFIEQKKESLHNGILMHLPMEHPASMIDAWFKLEDDVD